jgi:hypothetical protein
MKRLAFLILAACALGFAPGRLSAQALTQPPGSAQAFDLASSLQKSWGNGGSTVARREPQSADEQDQEADSGEEQEETPGLLVFLDCNRRTCDEDFLRQNITFINYVRDRQDAQVHILVTTQFAGAGQEYTFEFIGLEEFSGDDIRLVWVSSNTNTQDERREGVAQMIRVGMVHYIAKTPLIHQLEIRQQVQQADRRFLEVDPADDPWNFWVMRLSLNTQISGEDRRSNYNLRFTGSANRTTEAWKLRFSTNVRHDERKFVLNDGSESVGTTRSWTVMHQTVKSLSEHWGLSGKAAAWQASFTNHEFVVIGAPGIEYNIFPYSESSRRVFTITYEIGMGYNSYFEETIFMQNEETLIDHSLLVDLDVTQPWGELEGGVNMLQYLNHPDQWSLRLDGRIEFRIVRGLSFNVRGNWAAVRNQRFLPIEGQTNEEILLRQGALATNSEYEVNFGITWQFGSIFNNVVNPRFTDNRGGFGSTGFGGGGGGGGFGGGRD